MNNENIYKKYEDERKRIIDAVISSESPKKLIVAGPGTGKSRLFKQICEKNIAENKNRNLALSFINELVDDLAIELDQLAEVRTLHGLARSIIKGNKKIFIGLLKIISEDYKIIDNKDIDFEKAFNDPEKFEKDLSFYIERAKYYDFFCPYSLVYILTKAYEQDKNKIAKYSQILVDEFQDFNKLEAKLVDLLCEHSPVIIVGDDDQSLYSWKYAFPEEIRLKHKGKDYEKHKLPFCSRNTRVIVDSYNNFIKKATENGLLKNRVKKRYEYFPSLEKDRISDENPQIYVKLGVNRNSVAYYLEQEIKKLFKPKDKPEILVICSLKSQIDDLVKRLKEKGFVNIRAPTNTVYTEDELLTGFNLLLSNSKCNLGWRIVSKKILGSKKFKELLSKSRESNKKDFFQLLEKKDRKYIKSILALLRKIRTSEITTKEERVTVFQCLSYDLNKIATQKLERELNKTYISKNIYKNIPIRITNILGSKGLSYDYVFLVNFDDKYLVGQKISDEKICNFLVALTRARNRVTLFCGQKKLPTFIGWINNDSIEEI